MEIRDILLEIANESSTKRKMEILSKYKANQTLKDVLYHAKSKRVKFYLKQIPPYSSANQPTIDLRTALIELKYLTSREFTGDEASMHLADNILYPLSPDDAYVIERIIDKDLKIGMGTSNINKVFPKLIEETPYMGAKAYDPELVKLLFDKKNGGVVSQVKMDGRYCNAIIEGGTIELESRNGEKTPLEGLLFLEELTGFPDCVLNGELTIDNVPRFISNGIVASLVSIGKKKVEGLNVSAEIAKFDRKQPMSYQEAMKAVRFTVWDTISIDEYFAMYSPTTYDVRLANAIKLCLGCTMVSPIETKIVHSVAEAMADFEKGLLNGEEGRILKTLNGVWKDGKPKNQVKLKKDMTIDLKIVGFNYGTGKNSEWISSLQTMSSDGILRTEPGGIDEDMMEYITANQGKLLGTIVEVRCSGVCQDSKGEWSTMHPRFEKLRDDKDTANSLQECIDIDKATTYL